MTETDFLPAQWPHSLATVVNDHMKTTAFTCHEALVRDQPQIPTPVVDTIAGEKTISGEEMLAVEKGIETEIGTETETEIETGQSGRGSVIIETEIEVQGSEILPLTMTEIAVDSTETESQTEAPTHRAIDTETPTTIPGEIRDRLHL